MLHSDLIIYLFIYLQFHISSKDVVYWYFLSQNLNVALRF
jgi:hypothetical protein